MSIDKCVWKELVENKGSGMRTPNGKLLYCRDNCEGGK